MRNSPPPASLKVVALSGIMACSVFATAQTNVFNNTGNAGAGTTVPDAKLQIVSASTSGQPGLKLSWAFGAAGTGPNAFEINGKPPGGAYVPYVVLDNRGRLQIGATAGAIGDKLVVDGPVKLTSAGDAAGRKLNAGTIDRLFEINANTSSADGAGIELYGRNHAATPGEIHFSSYGVSPAPGVQFNTYDPVAAVWRSTMTLTGNNRVLIGDLSGVTAPEKLLVENDMRLTNKWDNQWRHFRGGTEYEGLEIAANNSGLDGPNIEMYGAKHGSRPGRIHFTTYGSGTAQAAMEFNTYDPAKSTWQRTMTLTQDNKVWIGQAPSGIWGGEYKLGVGGTLVAKRVVVQIDNWYDCVFAKDYPLRPLDEVAAFINENHHLPDVPAEKEVLKDGVDVGNMNAILLKKVEELTLYVIQQQQEIDELKQQIKK